MKKYPGTKYITKNATGYMIQKYNKNTEKMEILLLQYFINPNTNG